MASHLALQREFFAILGDFFKNATGESPDDFANVDEFGDAVHRKGKQFAPRAIKAFEKAAGDLKIFYGKGGVTTFQQARRRRDEAGAWRRQSFHKFSLGFRSKDGSVRGHNSDTRPGTAMARGRSDRGTISPCNLLQAVFFLLRLKPLVDANLIYPAVMVFQSWEKSLETNDAVTRERIETFIAAFFSRFLNKQFADGKEVLKYIRSSRSEFLDAVERNRIFIAPGGSLGEPLDKAIPRYKSEIQTWRSKEMNQQLSRYSDAELVWLGISERVAPQYHLLENAEELEAQPMLCLQPHWHYYSIYPFVMEPKPNEPRLILINPGVGFGKPVIAGTGISTAVVASRFNARESIDDLASEYGVKPQQIEEAIRWEQKTAAVAA